MLYGKIFVDNFLLSMFSIAFRKINAAFCKILTDCKFSIIISCSVFIYLKGHVISPSHHFPKLWCIESDWENLDICPHSLPTSLWHHFKSKKADRKNDRSKRRQVAPTVKKRILPLSRLEQEVKPLSLQVGNSIDLETDNKWMQNLKENSNWRLCAS